MSAPALSNVVAVSFREAGLSCVGADIILGSALTTAVGLFFIAWCVHLIVWRVRRPVAYPLWLPVIFAITPVFCVLLFWSAVPVDMRQQALLCLVFALPVYAVLSACYMGGYAGIIEYSPSAEILKAVRGRMPKGIAADRLEVPTLSEEALTGKRIRHLLDSKCAVRKADEITLTAKGVRYVKLSLFYRQLLFLRGEPQG